MRRQLAALLVVALVAVAGCAGGSAPATDDGASSGDQIYQTPLDTGTVVDAHASALTDAGSYTMESTVAQSLANSTQRAETTGVVRGNAASGALFLRTQSPRGQTVAVYTDGNGTAYERRAAGNRSQVRDASGRAPTADQYASSIVRPFIDLFNFTYTGTTTENGDTVAVYEADGVADLNTSSQAFANRDPESVEAAAATLHIRDDGVVTSLQSNTTFAQQNRSQTTAVNYTFSDIGSTEVTQPDWASDAATTATSQPSTTTPTTANATTTANASA
ncbi:hypothetical protein PNP85_01435 [Halobacterium salinarum]|uniref:Uncharacterized protein n=1 Tax=Halobacterium salinarum (strain ATCC 33171 / DSM 3754 / JCM 8978 / NBRC 102687 / NCIMB 764 / 91-R6) TaxID=2597657 RepID=A0A4D6GTX7_HALS9|nr:hypothetical protein [Halobacterium salinarum]MDL0131012.1 hypothetical protein [Halobacterium salinarum]MDL0133329.1 hypothetical protein [Halobacterium salinarum]MDL0137136.1 hypothetical protein [Halobacterium salinarum]MDL0138178.1 hypothetical protein [Halobacterium salinarum]MDL0144387.1 hypothetical protein [Halobacterium salinarum]